MGWTYFRKPESVKEWFEKQLTWDTEAATNKCLASSVSLHTGYAAVETVTKATGERRVWAAVYLFDFRRTKYYPYNFGYKNMDESMGPNEAKCLKRIMQLLTEPACNEWATYWRARCWERINRMKDHPKLEPGDTIRFAKPVFEEWGCYFRKEKHRQRHVFQCLKTGMLVHFRGETINSSAWEKVS